ncbi:hypothetical protein IWW50_003344, partial [Coemansia erecta]
TDKKPSYKVEHHGALITSTLCYSIDLSPEYVPHPESPPNSFETSSGDMGRQQLIDMQRYKQILCLVMLCSTVCWISLTATFALLLIRETMLPRDAGDSYVLKYAVVLVLLFTAWGITAATCVWRYSRYKFAVNAKLATVDWVTVGAPSIRMSSETAVVH